MHVPEGRSEVELGGSVGRALGNDGGGELVDEEARLVAGRDDPYKRMQKYERSLQVIRHMSLIAYVREAATLLVLLCALTWASAVVLGKYVDELSKGNLIMVPVLLLLQYLCVGLLLYHRTVSHTLHKRRPHDASWASRVLSIASEEGLVFLEVNLSLFMAGNVATFWNLATSSTNSLPPSPASPPATTETTYTLQKRDALRVFYVLIIINALIVLSEIVYKTFRLFYHLKESSARSLLDYNNMLQYNTSWAQPWLDLESAFKLQSLDYKYNRSAEKVCEEYSDLIWYLYMHEAGFEAAEAAMTNTDSYVKQTAANMVGFWAVLETLPEMQEAAYRLPLRLHSTALLSKLADVAGEGYGPAGRAAARTIALLLETDSAGRNNIDMAIKVRSSCKNELGLVEILVERVMELLPLPLQLQPSPCPVLASTLQDDARTYVHALRKLLEVVQLIPAPASVDAAITELGPRSFTQEQKKEVARQMHKLVQRPLTPPSSTPDGSIDDAFFQSLDNLLSQLQLRLPPPAAADANQADYRSEIKNHLLNPPNDPFNKTLLSKVLYIFVWFGVGYVVGLAIPGR